MNNPRAVMGVCVYSGDLHVGGQYRQRNSDMHPHKHLPSASARHAQRLEQCNYQSESHYFVPLEISSPRDSVEFPSQLLYKPV